MGVLPRGPRGRRRPAVGPRPAGRAAGPGPRHRPPLAGPGPLVRSRAGRGRRRGAGTVDVAMLRIDPPVDARYLHTTYLLDLAVAAGVRVVNNPAGVRALHEKLFALAMPELCPATVVGRQPAAARGLPPPPRHRGPQAGRRLRGPRRVAGRATARPAEPSSSPRPPAAAARHRAGVPARRRRRQQAPVPARRRDRRRGPPPPVRRRLPDRPAGRRRGPRRRATTGSPPPSARCSSRTASRSPVST